MWVQQAPPAKKPALTPLLRPKPGQEIYGRLCGAPLRVFLHFTSGRSWPCVGRACCLCKREIPRRYYAYYPVRSPKGVLGIMELTSQAESQLEKQQRGVTNVNEGEVMLRRAHGRRNMPCSIVWKEAEENGKAAVETLNVRELQSALLRIWNLPDMNLYVDVKEWLAATNKIIDARTISSQQVTQNP